MNKTLENRGLEFSKVRKSSKTLSTYEYRIEYKDIVELLKSKGMPEPQDNGIEIWVSGGNSISLKNYGNILFQIKRTECSEKHV